MFTVREPSPEIKHPSLGLLPSDGSVHSPSITGLTNRDHPPGRGSLRSCRRVAALEEPCEVTFRGDLGPGKGHGP